MQLHVFKFIDADSSYGYGLRHLDRNRHRGIRIGRNLILRRIKERAEDCFYGHGVERGHRVEVN